MKFLGEKSVKFCLNLRVNLIFISNSICQQIDDFKSLTELIHDHLSEMQNRRTLKLGQNSISEELESIRISLAMKKDHIQGNMGMKIQKYLIN